MAEGQREALEMHLKDRDLMSILKYVGTEIGWITYELIDPLLPVGISAREELDDPVIFATRLHGTHMYAQTCILQTRKVATTVFGKGNAKLGTGVYCTDQIETARGFSPAAQPFGNYCHAKVV
jgi:hypothetical protein